MERRGNLGAPMDLFIQRPTRTLTPNSQNSVMDLVAIQAARKKKALKEAEGKNRRFNREFFETGDRVVIQDQITNKWKKKGKIISSRPTHTDQGARSYVVETDDGKFYTRNTRFITRQSADEERVGPGPASQPAEQ